MGQRQAGAGRGRARRSVRRARRTGRSGVRDGEEAEAEADPTLVHGLEVAVAAPLAGWRVSVAQGGKRRRRWGGVCPASG